VNGDGEEVTKRVISLHSLKKGKGGGNHVHIREKGVGKSGGNKWNKKITTPGLKRQKLMTNKRGSQHHDQWGENNKPLVERELKKGGQ